MLVSHKHCHYRRASVNMCHYHASVLQQFGGYGGYHGTQQELVDATNGDMSPTSSKQPHMSRELRRLFEHSDSMPDGHRGNQVSGSGRAHRAHSLPESKPGSAKHRYTLCTL